MIDCKSFETVQELDTFSHTIPMDDVISIETITSGYGVELYRIWYVDWVKEEKKEDG